MCNWLVPLPHWQKCDTETSHPAVGNLSRAGLVDLTQANPSASLCMDHHTVASSLLLLFLVIVVENLCSVSIRSEPIENMKVWGEDQLYVSPESAWGRK